VCWLSFHFYPRLKVGAPCRSLSTSLRTSLQAAASLSALGWLGRKGLILAPMLLAIFLVVACEGEASSHSKVLYIGGIPDQEAAHLTRIFGSVADYLSTELDVEVRYVPSVDYAAVVAAFKRGDMHLAWFGGLTGVQARASVPGSEAIAQRPRDAQFHSVFVVQTGYNVENLEDLKGLTFTFGSESSTSGHLMPRYFLLQAGIDPEKGFQGKPSFSGSHDKTWKLVESGAFQAGVLNEAVWEKAVEDGKVDSSRIRAFYTTPAYFDYNWTIRGDVDQNFGQGFKEKVRAALLAMGPEQKEVLDLFFTDAFIETRNENYQAIEGVARQLDILR